MPTSELLKYVISEYDAAVYSDPNVRKRFVTPPLTLPTSHAYSPTAYHTGHRIMEILVKWIELHPDDFRGNTEMRQLWRDFLHGSLKEIAGVDTVKRVKELLKKAALKDVPTAAHEVHPWLLANELTFIENQMARGIQEAELQNSKWATQFARDPHVTALLNRLKKVITFHFSKNLFFFKISPPIRFLSG